MPSFERPTDSSKKFKADALCAHPVQSTAAGDSVSKSDSLLLLLRSSQHVRMGNVSVQAFDINYTQIKNTNKKHRAFDISGKQFCIVLIYFIQLLLEGPPRSFLIFSNICL